MYRGEVASVLPSHARFVEELRCAIGVAWLSTRCRVTAGPSCSVAEIGVDQAALTGESLPTRCARATWRRWVAPSLPVRSRPSLRPSLRPRRARRRARRSRERTSKCAAKASTLATEQSVHRRHNFSPAFLLSKWIQRSFTATIAGAAQPCSRGPSAVLWCESPCEKTHRGNGIRVGSWLRPVMRAFLTKSTYR